MVSWQTPFPPPPLPYSPHQCAFARAHPWRHAFFWRSPPALLTIFRFPSPARNLSTWWLGPRRCAPRLSMSWLTQPHLSRLRHQLLHSSPGWNPEPWPWLCRQVGQSCEIQQAILWDRWQSAPQQPRPVSQPIPIQTSRPFLMSKRW